MIVINNNFGLERSDVLNCRLVCKRWNGAVDMLYEKRTIPARTLCNENDDDDTTEICGDLGFQRCLGNYGFLADEMKVERMAEILDHPGILSSYPIFLRYLELTLPCETDEENETIEKFFEKFGKHIFYIDVHCVPENGLELFGELLPTFLQHTQNLKHLGVWKFTFFGEDNRIMTRSAKSMAQEMDKFWQAEWSPLKEPLGVIQNRCSLDKYNQTLNNA